MIPTYEEVGSKQAVEAEAEELAIAEDEDAGVTAVEAGIRKKDTRHLISRAVSRLVRAGGRKTEAEAAHLLEGIAVVVYDPETGLLDPALPPVNSGLRWDEFIAALVASYEARFEE